MSLDYLIHRAALVRALNTPWQGVLPNLDSPISRAQAFLRAGVRPANREVNMAARDIAQELRRGAAVLRASA